MLRKSTCTKNYRKKFLLNLFQTLGLRHIIFRNKPCHEIRGQNCLVKKLVSNRRGLWNFGLLTLGNQTRLNTQNQCY